MSRCLLRFRNYCILHRKQMKIEHLAIWAQDLEALKSFYINFFNASSGEKYHNASKQFSSYFLSFDNGCRLELMQMPAIVTRSAGNVQYTGLAHFAISAGSKGNVDNMTEQLR